MSEKKFVIKFDAPIELDKILSEFKSRFGIKTHSQAIRTLIKLSPRIEKYEVSEFGGSGDLTEIRFDASFDEVQLIDKFIKRFNLYTRTQAIEALIRVSPTVQISLGESLARDKPKIKKEAPKSTAKNQPTGKSLLDFGVKEGA